MKKSKLSILLLFLVMILAISAVSAADDTNDTSDAVMQAVDEAPLEEVASDSDVVGATDDTDIIADEGNNFTSLQTLIDQRGETVILDKDYVRVEGDSSLNINEDTTIVGGYHKIDAANLGGIFNVKSGVTLVLTGVTLVNGNSDYGGAIYNEGIVNIYDSTFENNTATVDGGAIYNNGTIEQLSSSTFKDNLALNDGGAVYTNTDLTVDYNSVFNENTAKHEGGAIFAKAKSSLTVDQTTFSENKVSEGNYVHGGAIATGTSCSLIVTGCIFEDNVADLTKNSQGGAIWTQAYCNVTITDSSFTNNQASRKGGAIYTGSKNSLIIKDSTFTKNTAAHASSNGGAIAMYTNGELSIEGDCEFIANSAANGGAIHLDRTDANITGAVFSGNDAANQGGAIYLFESGKTVSVKNSTFTDNTNNGEANSIYLSIGNLELSGNTIHGNESEIYVAKSGKLLSEITVDILNHETVATYDGTYLVNATVTDDNGNPMTIVKGLTFVTDGAEVEAVYNATTGVYEGLMTLPAPGIYTVNITYVDEDKLNVKTATINNYRGTFRDLQAKVDAATSGNLDLTYDFAFTPELGDTATDGIVISKALTINGNGHTISGSNAARIFKVTAATTINNVTIADGYYDANYGGAAIYATAALNVTNTNFTNNGAEDLIDKSVYGAVRTSTSASFDNCIFTNNYGRWGGAIGAEGSGTITIKNSKFENNNARQGGAIDIEGYTLIIDNTEFIGNDAVMLGGAVHTSQGTVATVTNSKFERNTDYQGGAICSKGSTGSLTVDNSEFIANEVTGTEMPVKETWSSGGAIWVENKLTLTNSNFTANKAEYNGGAVYVQDGAASATIDNCRFENNKAGVNYGAIVLYASTNKVSNSYFDNNSANGQPNAITLNKGNLELSGNTIEGIDSEILIRGGQVTSQINITVMDNDTYDYSFKAIDLYAAITDDKGNVITDSGFKFLVGTDEVAATFNPETKYYEAKYTPAAENEYIVSMNYAGSATLVIETATISFTRSLIDIQDMIDAAEAGDIINLTGDYKYVEELDSKLVDGIIINKTITIDGKGYTVSGSDANRMFYIKAHNVTLTNITFANGNASGKWGGAIYVNGAYENLTISDSKFYNNTADVNGGAIYWAGDKGKLIKSEFKENIAGESGGAVFWYGDDGEITGTTFEDNYAKSHGGAVVWFTYGTSGGHNGVINNSIFNNNEAGAAGGAVSWQSDNGKIIDSTFTENKAPNAGAVYWGANDGNITGGTFSKNNATDNLGGAIFIEKGSLYIESNFYENTAKNGGAVASFATAYIDSDFRENTATSQGGAIFALNADTTVNGSYFEDNTAPAGGMSIYVNGGTLALEGNFINNVEPEIDIENGGKLTSTIKVTILDGEVKTIETLEAELSAKVTDDKDNLIKDAQFKFTINDKEVAAVYNAANKLYEATYTLPSAGIYPVNITYASDDELEVENATVKSIYGTFTQLQQLIDNATDTLVLPYNFTYNAEIDGDALKAGVVIGKALTVDGNGSTISGADAARIFQLNANNINIKNTTFTNGYSNTSSQQFADWGGAIYSNGAYKGHVISDCKFYNNTAYNGGAIYLGGDSSNIIGCEFEYNNATTSGGAVFIVGWGDTISDSTFKFNMADELGGAVACYSSQQAAEITNSVFIGNVAFKNGGAVSMQIAAGKITDSNFTGNTASNAGAVYWGANGGSITGGEFIENEAVDNLGGAIFAEGAGLTISSTFTGNYAENGGAIAVFKDATITESNFTNNTADNYGGAVYVNGSAKLDIKQSVMKNNTATVGSSIYSNGTIESTIINATILENNTWYDAELGKLYVLNATLTDDMGNSIYDPNFRFTVNGDEIAVAPKYDDETGLYTIGYTIQKAGLNIVSTSYNAASLQVFTGALDIPLANVTEFTVFVSHILEGENATVWITLIGVNDEGLNSTVTVIVNNKEYPVPVVNGTGNRTIENLTHGQYPVVAMFEDPNYNSEINSTVFNVKGQSVLNITELTVAEYGDEIEITINLTDTKGNPISGIVVIDDVTQVLVYEDGIGAFVIDNQPDVGNYTFQAVYKGNDDYFGDLAIFNVTVTTKDIDPNDVIVDIPNINEFGDEIPITITSPVDGTYTVNINGTTVQVEVINSTGNATVKLDKPGIYNATVNIDEEEYTLETITTDDFEYLVTPEFNVVITGTYPDATVTIEGTDGNYTVYIDEGHTFEMIVKDGVGSANTTGLFAGDYTAFVTFNAHDEYYGDYKEIDFTVAKANIILSVIPDDSVEGEAAAIYIYADSDVNTTVRLIVDDKVLGEYSVTNGSAIVNVTEDQGQHNVIVEIADDNYDATPASGSFYVKYVTELTVSTDNEEYDYGEDVTISVKLNATGQSLVFTVSLTVGEDEYNVLVEYGDGELVLSDLPVGNYTILSYFNGDNINNYTEGKEVTFKVNPKVIDPSDVDFSLEGDYDDGLNITIKSPVDTTYIVDIEGYGPVTVEVNNGTGSAIVNIEEPGDYDANISIADGNYSLEPINYPFTYKAAPEFNVTISGTYPTASVIITGVPGDYHISIDGFEKQFNVTVDESGVAEFPIDGLNAGNYAAAVSYDVNDYYYGDYKDINFTVAKAASSVTIEEPIADVIFGEPTVIKFHIENETGFGEILITDENGNSYDRVVVNDTVTANLPAGSYAIYIHNGETDNYEESEAYAYFNVTKAEALNVEILNFSSVGVVTRFGVNITVGPNATGKLFVSRNGTAYIVDNLVDDYYYYFDEEVIGVGSYVLDVRYLGDSNYNETEKSQTISIATTNVVTNDTFFGFFDEDGVLRDAVPFDELIFFGEFSDLGIEKITINRPVDITGDEDGAILYGIALDIEADGVFVTDIGLFADGVKFTTNNGALIYVEASDVTLDQLDVEYEAPADSDPYAIYVINSDGFTLKSSSITFIGNEANPEYQYALRVADSDNVLIQDNVIYAELPARGVDYGQIGIYQDSVLAVGIQNGDNVLFTENDVEVNVIGETSWTTLDAIMVYGVTNLEISYNNISLLDSENNNVGYYHAIDLYSFSGTVLSNNIIVNTTTGMPGSGDAYPIQLNGPYSVVVSYNNLTAISNGPSIGILSYNWAGSADLTAAFNNIEVIGSGEPGMYGAVTSGIELQVNNAKVYNNTIIAESLEDYNETLNVFGISNAQNATVEFLDIQDNTVYTSGKYAVVVYYAVESLVTGNYLIAHELYGDGAVYALGDATVKANYPQDLNITITVENCTVSDPVEISVTTNPLFNGQINVTIGTNDYIINITDGEGSDMLDSLDANTYNVVASYAGDDYFKADEDNATLVVSRLVSNITITTGDVVVDAPLVVNVTMEYVDGNVTVIVDGNKFPLALDTGLGTFTIPKENMTAGNHSITVIFTGDDTYDPADSTYKFTVEKAEGYEFDVNLTIDEIDIGENVTINVTLPEDANGNITVTVDGKPVTFEKVVNGTATVTVPADAFTAGRNNTIAVTYSDDKYGETTVTKEIPVNKLPYAINATADNIELGQNATIIINVPAGADGKATVELQGNFYPAVNGTVILEGLGEGTYTANVYFFDDSVYEDNHTTVTFNVTKVEITPEQAFNFTTPENSTSEVISVNLPEDATGFLLLDINGTQTHVPLVNGTANVTVPNLEEGTYNATITYTGDDKYAPISTTKEINVTSNVPQNALNIPAGSKSDEPTTYSISLPGDAGGFLMVDVDGTKYAAPLNNGSASVTIPALSPGSHNVTVTYTGDDKYSPVTKATTLNVTAPVFKITNNKNVAAVYSAKATYKVLITRDGKAVGAGEAVTFKYNGKTYTVKTDSKGYATFKPSTKVKVKKYTVTATYKGVSVKNTVTIKHVIKAKNKKVKKSKKVNKVVITLKKVNKKYLKKKTIKVKFKGKTYKVKTNKKGKATWKVKKSMLKKLKVGKKYKYKVTYGKDIVTKKLTIKK